VVRQVLLVRADLLGVKVTKALLDRVELQAQLEIEVRLVPPGLLEGLEYKVFLAQQDPMETEASQDRLAHQDPQEELDPVDQSVD
jgi:hypothetical protein